MSDKKKILVVDDEPDIRELIAYNLSKEGYEVTIAADGKEAVEQAKKQHPDLVLLDMMMPVMDGIAVCRTLRRLPQFKDTFIVFLTARSEETAELGGFEAGADDYITKPIKPRILLSRISAILRRNVTEVLLSGEKLTVKDIIIDPESFLVYRGSEKIVFAKKEFELLHLLASKPGKVFTREVILQQIWDDNVIVTHRTIDVHIRKIREKLGEGYLSTIKGVGYKFEIEGSYLTS